MKIDTNSLVSATDLNRNSGQLLARASNGERLVVLNQNRPFAAIVSIEDLNRLEKLDVPDIPSTPQRPTFDPGFAPKQLANLDAAQGYTGIGQTLDEQTVALKLACHTLVMGAPGSGKSVTLSAAIAGARSPMLRWSSRSPPWIWWAHSLCISWLTARPRWWRSLTTSQTVTKVC